MDMWTDLNLSTELGLDFLDQPNGLFGDLKSSSRLSGDMDPALKPRDAVEQLAYSPVSEGHLDDYWMESGDLGSFLDSLADDQIQLPLEESLFDCSQELSHKDSVNIAQTKSVAFAPSFDGDFNSFVQGLTPPESPEQVTPVIKLDPEFNDSQFISVISPQDISQPVLINSEVVPSVVEYTSSFILGEHLDSKPELIEDTDILSLSYNPFIGNDIEHENLETEHEENICVLYSSDGDIVPVSPPEASPVKPSIDSLIQSSPELYKVIATPSARFSPYSKVKGEQKTETKTSKSKSRKLSPELIPEEFISNHLGKKERKKLQNKNAAIRYRQKKKAEVENIVGEVQGLEDKNTDLKSKVDDLNREIKYMKSLMEDIYKAKGLVK